MNKNASEAWLTVVFMRGSDKRKYRELINDFSIWYVIKNDQYLKIPEISVDIMREV